MSDARDEAEDVGQADPITGVTAGGDDLARDTVLPDEEAGPTFDEVATESRSTITNDAVAGETVLPGAGDGNDGPTGGAPGEVAPIQPENELDPDSIDLDDER